MLFRSEFATTGKPDASTHPNTVNPLDNSSLGNKETAQARSEAFVNNSAWWRDRNISAQVAQNVFQADHCRISKRGAFIGTPEDLIPADPVEPVSPTVIRTYSADIITANDTTIVTAPAPTAMEMSAPTPEEEPESATIITHSGEAYAHLDDQADAAVTSSAVTSGVTSSGVTSVEVTQRASAQPGTMPAATISQDSAKIEQLTTNGSAPAPQHEAEELATVEAELIATRQPFNGAATTTASESEPHTVIVSSAPVTNSNISATPRAANDFSDFITANRSSRKRTAAPVTTSGFTPNGSASPFSPDSAVNTYISDTRSQFESPAAATSYGAALGGDHDTGAAATTGTIAPTSNRELSGVTTSEPTLFKPALNLQGRTAVSGQALVQHPELQATANLQENDVALYARATNGHATGSSTKGHTANNANHAAGSATVISHSMPLGHDAFATKQNALWQHEDSDLASLASSTSTDSVASMANAASVDTATLGEPRSIITAHRIPNRPQAKSENNPFDFSDFTTANGSVTTGAYRVPVTSQKQLQAQREEAAKQAAMAAAAELELSKKLIHDLHRAIALETLAAHNTAESYRELQKVRAALPNLSANTTDLAEEDTTAIAGENSAMVDTATKATLDEATTASNNGSSSSQDKEQLSAKERKKQEEAERLQAVLRQAEEQALPKRQNLTNPGLSTSSSSSSQELDLQAAALSITLSTSSPSATANRATSNLASTSTSTPDVSDTNPVAPVQGKEQTDDPTSATASGTSANALSAQDEQTSTAATTTNTSASATNTADTATTTNTVTSTEATTESTTATTASSITLTTNRLSIPSTSATTKQSDTTLTAAADQASTSITCAENSAETSAETSVSDAPTSSHPSSSTEAISVSTLSVAQGAATDAAQDSAAAPASTASQAEANANASAASAAAAAVSALASSTSTETTAKEASATSTLASATKPSLHIPLGSKGFEASLNLVLQASAENPSAPHSSSSSAPSDASSTSNSTENSANSSADSSTESRTGISTENSDNSSTDNSADRTAISALEATKLTTVSTATAAEVKSNDATKEVKTADAITSTNGSDTSVATTATATLELATPAVSAASAISAVSAVSAVSAAATTAPVQDAPATSLDNPNTESAAASDPTSSAGSSTTVPSVGDSESAASISDSASTTSTAESDAATPRDNSTAHASAPTATAVSQNEREDKEDKSALASSTQDNCVPESDLSEESNNQAERQASDASTASLRVSTSQLSTSTAASTEPASSATTSVSKEEMASSEEMASTKETSSPAGAVKSTVAAAATSSGAHSSANTGAGAETSYGNVMMVQAEYTHDSLDDLSKTIQSKISSSPLAYHNVDAMTSASSDLDSLSSQLSSQSSALASGDIFSQSLLSPRYHPVADKEVVLTSPDTIITGSNSAIAHSSLATTADSQASSKVEASDSASAGPVAATAAPGTQEESGDEAKEEDLAKTPLESSAESQGEARPQAQEAPREEDEPNMAEVWAAQPQRFASDSLSHAAAGDESSLKEPPVSSTLANSSGATLFATLSAGDTASSSAVIATTATADTNRSESAASITTSATNSASSASNTTTSATDLVSSATNPVNSATDPVPSATDTASSTATLSDNALNSISTIITKGAPLDVSPMPLSHYGDKDTLGSSFDLGSNPSYTPGLSRLASSEVMDSLLSDVPILDNGLEIEERAYESNMSYENSATVAPSKRENQLASLAADLMDDFDDSFEGNLSEDDEDELGNASDNSASSDAELKGLGLGIKRSRNDN